MKLIVLFATLGVSITAAWAGYQVREAKSGMVVASDAGSDYFALEIAGNKVKRLESDSPSQLYFMVDKRFLQITPIGFAEFHGDAKASADEAIRKYLQAESDFYKQPLADFHIEKTELANKHTAFTADVVLKADGPDARRQIFLIFRYGNSLMELGSVLGGTDTKETILEYLNQIANTFVSASQPIEFEKSPGGAYRIRKP